MTTVAERTEFPAIFCCIYWGKFESTPNPFITDQVIRNRNAFAEKYQIGQRAREPFLNPPPTANEWDHIECYYIRTTPNARLVVTSPYYVPAEQKETRRVGMAGLGFLRIAPIYSERAESFARLFCSKREFQSFWENIQRQHYQEEGRHYNECQADPEYCGVPVQPVHESYAGRIIYATPGSGKSELVACCNSLIDTDVLLLAEITKQHPTFQIDATHHVGQVLLQFCRTYSRRVLQPIYESVSEQTQHLAREQGCTVLTGSRALMHIADFVFIQTNAAIVRQEFDQDLEKEQALQMGKFIPIERYLKDIMCYPCDDSL